MQRFEFSASQRHALAALIGLGVIGLGMLYGRQHRGATDEVVLREPGSRVTVSDSDRTPGSYSSSAPRKAMVHVAGEVARPGVYELAAGSRVNDAIQAAGGPTANADLDTVNLAEVARDGSKIFVAPKVTAPVGQFAASGSNSKSAGGSKSGKLTNPGEGVVHINSATSDQLQRLPGAGPAIAQRIIDYRGSVGRFARPEQLMDVKGIGPKTFEKMRPFVSL